MPSTSQSIATIDQFISAVGGYGEKNASDVTVANGKGAVKAADGSKPISEPGSIGGDTSHPVKTVDDRLQEPKEGERFKENTKDVNEDQGKPSIQNAAEAKAGADKAADVFGLASRFALGTNGQTKAACDTCGKHPCECNKKAVDKRAEGGAVMQGGSAEEDHYQIGTKVAPTGEDPKSETGSAKAGKEDKKEGGMGGTSHPANTENDKIDGHKWSFDQNTPLEQMVSMMKDAGDNICAQIAWVSNNQGAPKTAEAAQQAAPGVAPVPPARGQSKQAEVDPYLAQQVGWELAGLINGTFDKRAADSLVQNVLYTIQKEAADDAARFCDFMDAYLTAEKRAEGEPPPGAGAPPEGGGPPGGGEAPGENEAAMMAALGGGAGGPPPGGGGGEMPPGGGGGGDAEAMQLAQILEQLGVSPEELEQALQQQGGGMGGELGGGPPPGGGAPPPPGGAPPGGGGAPPPGMEAAAGDRGGRQPTQKQAQHDKSAHMHAYISEIVQRSRARRSA
jgi:hypothetical protein